MLASLPSVLGRGLAASLLAAWAPAPSSPAAGDAPSTDAAVVHAGEWPRKWEAPAACPQGEAVRARVAQLLAPDMVIPEALVHANARVIAIEEGDARWQLELELGEGVPTRAVTAEACADLGEVAALILALAVDPLAVARATEPRPEPPPEPEPEPEPEPPPEPEPLPEPEPEPTKVRPTAFVSPRIGLASGLLPGAIPTLSAAIGVELPSLRVELAGTFSPQRTEFAKLGGLDINAAVGGRYTMGYASARACPTVRLIQKRSTLSAPLCVGVAFGGVRNEPIGLEQPRAATAAWGAAQLAPALSWKPSPRAALWLGIESNLSFLSAAFSAGGLAQPLYETPFFSIQGQVGFELHFE
ncbi:hypothetical protein [Plesiocystis pacifica]|uniref:hypothetical protein n=1 Tax=Plesiocystis pacifica TaxID=191768 RepID=UPI0018DCB64D|nr:hypothetical protein [Plesiocystis pacifica]